MRGMYDLGKLKLNTLSSHVFCLIFEKSSIMSFLFQDKLFSKTFNFYRYKATLLLCPLALMFLAKTGQSLEIAHSQNR